MAEVLSQSQIDELLKGLAGGDETVVEQPEAVAQKKARKYDFHTPKKFTKDNLKLLDSIYVNYGRVLQTQLSSLLRLNCEIELLNVEEQSYNEFNNALNDNDVVATLGFGIEQDGYGEKPVLLFITDSIIFVMLDRMLGGFGEEVDDDFRGFTDIEISVLRNIYGHLVPLMNDVWQNYLQVKIDFEGIEENPKLLQAISLDDTVVIIMLSVTIRNASGQIHICMPGSALEELFHAFDSRKKTSRNPKASDESKKLPNAIITNLSASMLELTVKLGDAEISLGDVFKLREGDIINLRKPKDSDVLLYVEDKPWFTGELGVKKQHMALKIKDQIRRS